MTEPQVNLNESYCCNLHFDTPEKLLEHYQGRLIRPADIVNEKDRDNRHQLRRPYLRKELIEKISMLKQAMATK
jgi:hypothetical protein